jgi:NagD protein
MIGDRMDTDMVAGIETGLDTVLVLSGVSTRETVERFPYRPRLILNGVGDIAAAAASEIEPAAQ